MNSPYQFALEMFDSRGAPIGQETILVDLLPAEEWTRFMAIRTGAIPLSSMGAETSLHPIWHLERGRPYTEAGVVHRDNLGWMLDPLGPGHRGDVNQTFDALFQLHEGTVIGETDDLAGHSRAHGIAFFHLPPWIGRPLLVTQRHSFPLGIELENHDLDLGADGKELGGMIDAAP